MISSIESERLLLRAVSFEDIEDVFEFTSQKEVTHFLSWEAHQNQSRTKLFLEYLIDSYQDNKPYQWGIEIKEKNKLIGITGYNMLDLDNARAEISFIMSPNFAGKGYMTEANQMVLRHAFKELGLNRVQAKAEPANIASQKVLEKIGMKKEGLFRSYLKVKGSFRDYIYYSILQSEFNSIYGQ